MTKTKRYVISIVRLFLSTFITTLIIQIQTIGDISSKTLVSLFLGVLITSVTTIAKYIQEQKLLDKIINTIIK